MSIISKKAMLMGAILIALITLAGGSTYAYVSWQNGHDNLQATSANIDTLVGRINTLKNQVGTDNTNLNNLTNTNKQLAQQLDALKASKDSDNASHQQEINQKINEINAAIADGNTKVAQVQKQVEAKQAIIDSLTNQLNDEKQYSNQLDQALIDAQNVRTKSDQAVEQTKVGN